VIIMDNDIVDNSTPPADTPAPPPEVKDTRPYPVRYAEQQQNERAAAEAQKLATMTPTEKRINALNKPGDAGIYSKDPAKQKAAMVELRQLMASSETEEEKTARARLTVTERREQYGVEPPTLPKPYLENYNREFAGWEPPLFDIAHEHGLAAEQVRGLRDAAIDLGQVVGDTGRSASEEDLKRVFDKYRVAPSAHAVLTKLWRQIEGGAS
jgi:hypothetical protein